MMIRDYNEVATTQNIENSLNIIGNNEAVQSMFVMIADSPELDTEKLDLLFKKQNKKIIGGVFPQIIYNNVNYNKGFYILGCSQLIDTIHFDLTKDLDNIEDALFDLNEKTQNKANTIWVFMDAFSQGKGNLIDSLYNTYGSLSNYVGGGAGTLQLKSTPCIISNNGLTNNSAVVGIMNARSNIGVAHGWTPISEPVKVTKTTGNNINSIEWKNAFEYYKEIIKKHSGLEINSDNFFEIAKSYPLGLMKLNSEFIVRDPISADGKNITIIDLVPQNEFIQVLNGNKQSLFSGAALAAREAEKLAHSSTPFYFCIDCISRVLFLGEDFKNEIDELKNNGNIMGVLTIGEIANAGNSILEIYNKTVVVCKMIID